MLAVETRRRPQLADALRVIEVIGPSTIPPAAVSATLPAALQAAIQVPSAPSISETTPGSSWTNG